MHSSKYRSMQCRKFIRNLHVVKIEPSLQKNSSIKANAREPILTLLFTKSSRLGKHTFHFVKNILSKNWGIYAQVAKKLTGKNVFGDRRVNQTSLAGQKYHLSFDFGVQLTLSFNMILLFIFGYMWVK